MDNKENKLEIPKLECIGCKKRDDLIQNLAEHIDKQNDEIKEMKQRYGYLFEKEIELAA